MRWLSVAFVCSLALGCGGSESDEEETVDTLDCAWLEGDKCWKTTLAGATSCLPAEGDVGVLAADGLTCTYASGHVVTFDEPLVLPLSIDDDVHLRFTLTAGGTACMRFVETQSAMTVTVGDQTFKQQAQGGVGLRAVCPDGSSYSNDNGLDLLECRDDLLSAIALMPGSTWGSGSTSISFGLIGYSVERSLHIFDCRQ